MSVAHILDQHGWVNRMEFDFRDSGIRDSDIKILEGLHKLEKVDLSHTLITRDGFAELLSLYPKIEIVTNSMSSRPTK